MRQTLRYVLYILGGLAAVALLLVLEFLRHGGQFRTPATRFAGRCETLPLAASAEDIRIDAERGIAYLSYLDRRAQVDGEAAAGTVLLLDLNLPDPQPRAALLEEPPAFRPHGMSLLVPPDGRRRLFVISHPEDAPHEVLIFEETVTGSFALVEAIRDPLLVDPNAVLAVGPRQFYVANDTGARNGFERGQELLLRRGLATVAYYDGTQMRAEVTGLKTPSGIAANNELTRVYVSETSGNRIAIFKRDVVSGRLEATGHIEVGSAPDNLHIDSDDRLWIAAHAKLLALVRHFGDATRAAPTQVLVWAPGEGEDVPKPDTVYMNPGEELSAGSVAAPWRDLLLIGSITERKLLRCPNPLAAGG